MDLRVANELAGGVLDSVGASDLKSTELEALSARIAATAGVPRSAPIALEGVSLAPVPEPSTVLFGSALLVACGASLRAVRRKI